MSKHPWRRPHDSPEPHGNTALRAAARRTRRLWRYFRQLERSKKLLVAIGTPLLLMAVVLLASFIWPRNVQFGFARPNCFTSPVILPGLVRQMDRSRATSGPAFTVTPMSTVSIAGHPVYSHTTCVSAAQAPRTNANERVTLQHAAFGFLHKTVSVRTGTPPTVSYQTQLAKPLATQVALTLQLSTADQVFDYELATDSHTAPCRKNGTQLSCDTAQLQLAQSASYTLSLHRLFAGRAHNTVFSQTVSTVGAMSLENSSITSGQTVYDKPDHITLTFNKQVKSYNDIQLMTVPADGGAKQKVPIDISTSGNDINLAFKQELPRRTNFELRIRNVTAPDGGRLPEPLVLGFSTSGGPRVESVNIGSYKVSASSNITLTFDTPVSGSQQLTDYIRLEVDGKPVAASLARNGRQVTINPVADLGRCTRFTVRVADGLQNEHGVDGSSAWSHNSRTVCHSTFSIGKSVNGRSITGYRFGGGSSLIVYAGNIHGNEKSANATLQSWIDHLERNYDDIPGGRSIVVIPNLNPDGYAANTRTNAHNVDLNRNFAASNWKSSVTMPGGTLNPNGGGSSPLSEPESSAFANYIADNHPRLVLTYHSTAGIVMPNDAGDSDSLARIYDQKSNLNYEATSQNDAIFQYDTTGSFEDWANQKHNTPVLLIELWTRSNNEFSKNQNAMWHMATL